MVTLSCGSYGNVIRLLPPLVIDDALLADGLEVLAGAVEDVLCPAPDPVRLTVPQGCGWGNAALTEASPASRHWISWSASRTRSRTRCPVASLAEATAASWTSAAARITSTAWVATSAGTVPADSTRST